MVTLKKIFGASLAACLLSTSVHASNLIDIYKQALRNDPTFKQAESTWLSQKQNLAIARSAYLPQLQFIGSLDFQHVETRPEPSPTNNTDGNSGEYDYTLSLTQPLFNAQTWQSIKGAHASVKAATATYLAAEQDLMQRVSTAYFNVLQAYDKLRFTLANKRAVKQQLVTAEQKFKVGLIAITGVYDAQSVYDQAAANEIRDRNLLENSIEDLRAITGKHYYALNGLGHQVPLSPPKPNNINAWVKTANHQNYSIASQRYLAIAARDNIHEIEAGHLPSLDLTSTYEDTKSFSHENNAPNNSVSEATVGLSMNFNIFQGGSVIAQTKQARYDYLTASSALEFTHREVVKDTRQAFLGVISGVSQVKADKQSIKSAQNAVEATKAGYTVGTRTMVDVLNDLSTLYQNQQKYADDQYAYINSIIALKAAAGTLSLNDLVAINRWLGKKVDFPLNPAVYGDRVKSVKIDLSDVSFIGDTKPESQPTDNKSDTKQPTKKSSRKKSHRKQAKYQKAKSQKAKPQKVQSKRIKSKPAHHTLSKPRTTRRRAALPAPAVTTAN